MSRLMSVALTEDAVAREGVPAHVYARSGHDAACRDCGVVSWTAWYSRVMGVSGDDWYVTRIEWRYLDGPDR